MTVRSRLDCTSGNVPVRKSRSPNPHSRCVLLWHIDASGAPPGGHCITAVARGGLPSFALGPVFLSASPMC